MKTDGKTWLGIILIFIGALLVIDNYGFFQYDIRHLIFSWHTIMLVIGIILLSRCRNSTLGIIFVLIGLYGLFNRLFPFYFGEMISDLWPLIIILIGLFLLLNRRPEQKQTRAENFTSPLEGSSTGNAESIPNFTMDYIDETVIFTSASKIIVSENFRGGKITTLLGTSKIDLSNCKLAPGNHTLEINCIFGGCTVIVPRNVKTIINVSAIFGGFDDKRYLTSLETPVEGSVLIINGAVVFGGGELYSR